jgi:hypothetical protein
VVLNCGVREAKVSELYMDCMHRLLRKLEAKVSGRRKVEESVRDDTTASEATSAVVDVEEDSSVIGVSP